MRATLAKDSVWTKEVAFASLKKQSGEDIPQPLNDLRLTQANIWINLTEIRYRKRRKC
jgi:hypothetical protein